MKNIHVLPTDKPSRLWINNLLQCKLELSEEALPYNTAQNIYITSDEEIKEGDWYWLEKIGRIGSESGAYKSSSVKSSKLNTLASNCKKIILTTDQDLIKDGVQAIDDEFLEWFVKNPNCEWIKVVEDIKYFNIDELRERHIKGLPYLYSEKIGYKIIIPKEEPNIINDWLEKNGDPQITKQVEQEAKELCKQEKRYSEDEVKKIALDFFYHWWNSDSTNTEQCFDKWFKQKSC